MADRKVYTDKEKAEALKRINENGLRKTARDMGIATSTLTKWKAEAGLKAAQDQAAAKEIEVKKASRAAGRKVKEKAEKAAASVSEQAAATEIEVRKTGRAAGRKVKEKAEQVAAAVSEQAQISSVEVSKTAKKAGRKVKEAVKDTAEQIQRDAMLNIVIQSQSGHAVSALQICQMVPEGTTDVYVKAEEGKLYYVLRDGSTGSVDLW